MTTQTKGEGPSIRADLDRSWIAGHEWTRSAGSIEHRSPFDGRDLGATQSADGEAVAAAVAVARRCYELHWGKWTYKRRAEVIAKFADLLLAHANELAVIEALEMGRPIRGARQLIAAAPDFVAKYLVLGAAAVGDLFAAEDHRLGAVWRRPRGVVAAIIPWNVPVMNFLVRAVPALTVGNTIVVKPSECAPRSAVLLGKIASEAGFPDGAVNVVLGLGAVAGQALAAHPDVDLLAFTGSTETGRIVSGQAVSSRSKPVLLECGGKSPQIVLEDAFESDDPGMWDLIFHSAFWNSGQWCVAKTRLLVPRSRVEDALKGLRTASSRWHIGDPLDEATTLGPLANSTQRERVAKYFDLARGEGELVELACTRGSIPLEGCFITPSVALKLPRSSSVVQQEVFGPLLSLETFEDIDDAISSANCTDYGLQASVWTKRADLGYRLARNIAAGSITVYASAQAAIAAQADPPRRYYEPQKRSGQGMDGGLEGLLAYTTAQAVSFMS